MNDKSYLCNYSNKLVFYGNFNTKKNKPNVLLLLPKTRGPFGIKEFKQAIRKKFNLLEFDDVKSEKLTALSQNKVISFEQKIILKKILLDEGYPKNFVRRKKIGYIIPYNDWIKSQKKFEYEFRKIMLQQKNKKIDYTFIERRLLSILKCNIGKELRKLVLPKLFINSVDDKLMKPYHAKELHKLCFNSKLITLDGGGHMLTETRAQDLIGHINSFVKVLGK